MSHPGSRRGVRIELGGPLGVGLFSPQASEDGVHPGRVPKVGTLRRYGLTFEDWRAILERQGWVCAVCDRVPASGRWVVDHEHVAGWKKMSPKDRKRHVRGVICSFCNSHCIGRFVTLAKARNILSYLERYHAGRDEGL